MGDAVIYSFFGVMLLQGLGRPAGIMMPQASAAPAYAAIQQLPMPGVAPLWQGPGYHPAPVRLPFSIELNTLLCCDPSDACSALNQSCKSRSLAEVAAA